VKAFTEQHALQERHREAFEKWKASSKENVEDLSVDHFR
jgi:hypothetical protein